ncbi:MAG: cobalamin-dependent protein [Candidatus Buchananbacteria bacterium]
MIIPRVKLLRLIIPAYPPFNPYNRFYSRTTALGAILTASAANKIPGWEVEVIDENNCPDTPACLKLAPDGHIDHEFLQKERPADIVGFSASLSSAIPRVFKLAEIYQSQGALTVAGGYHVTALPEEALDHHLDIVIMDNEEKTIMRVMKVYDSLCRDIDYDLCLANRALGTYKNNRSSHFYELEEKIKNYWLEVDGIAFRHIDETIINPPADQSPNCRSASLPDFSLLRYGKIKIYPINWHRGCPLKCEFCAVRKKPSKESALDLLKVVRYYHEKFGAKNFFVVDDQFGGDLNNPAERDQLIAALRLLINYQKRIKKRFKFNVQIKLNASDDAELLLLLRQAGVTTVRVSYESSLIEAPKLNDGTHHRTVKSHTVKLRAMVCHTRQWRQAGFLVHGMFIFNYPRADITDALKKYGRLGVEALQILDFGAITEPAESLVKPPTIKDRVIAVKEFIRRADINTIQVSLAVPSPGTALRDRLKKSGQLFPVTEIGWEYYDGQFPLYQPGNCEAEEMWQGAQDIMSGFYGLKNFFRRTFFSGWPLKRNQISEAVRRDFSDKLKRAKTALNQ